VFRNQGSLGGGIAVLDKIAADVGVDMEKLKKDLKNPEVKDRISRDTDEAKRFGFSGTPSFVINGVKLVGAQPIENFEEVIKFTTSSEGK